MNTYVVILRLIHILSGVFWVGGALLMALFVGPSLQAAGPASGPVMQQLVKHRRAPDWLGGAAVVTVLAGLLLYWEVSAGLVGDWVSTPPGIAISVGGLLGLAAAVIGVSVAAPATRRALALAVEIQKAEGEPDPAENERLMRLRQRSTSGIRWVAIAGSIAAGAMAVAEYL